MIKSEFEKFYMSKNPYGRSTLDGVIKNSYQNPYILEERQLNVTALDLFSKMLYDRILFLNEVTPETANVMQAQLLYLDSIGQETIEIYIASPGGSCNAGLGIYDTLQTIKSDTHSTCISLAASFGAVILAACDKRSALEHSSIMIHQPLIMGGGITGKATDIEIEAQEMQKTKKTLYKILSKHTGKTEQEIWDACEHDNWLTPEEALKFGLIDEVIHNPDRSDKRFKK
jgi:ATP-dependent Clp protease, protease subunit